MTATSDTGPAPTIVAGLVVLCIALLALGAVFLYVQHKKRSRCVWWWRANLFTPSPPPSSVALLCGSLFPLCRCSRSLPFSHRTHTLRLTHHPPHDDTRYNLYFEDLLEGSVSSRSQSQATTTDQPHPLVVKPRVGSRRQSYPHVALQGCSDSGGVQSPMEQGA
jgi:hypothetical protein